VELCLTAISQETPQRRKDAEQKQTPRIAGNPSIL